MSNPYVHTLEDTKNPYELIAKLLWNSLCESDKVELAYQIHTCNSIDWEAWLSLRPYGKLYDEFAILADREVIKHCKENGLEMPLF